MGEESQSGGGVNGESKSRISFRNAAQKVNHFRKRQSLSIDNSFTDAQGEFFKERLYRLTYLLLYYM